MDNLSCAERSAFLKTIEQLEKDYQKLQGDNWKNIQYLNDKIEKLEKENESLKWVNEIIGKEFKKTEKENTIFKSKLASVKIEKGLEK